MGLGDFWLQSNNGKKYNLKDLKDLKPEDIAKNPKLQKFIKLFDFDNSGTIEIKNKDGQNEWKSIFTELQEAAVDNDLSREEFSNYISQKLPDEDLSIDDVNELLDIATCESDVEELKQVGNKLITTQNGRVTQVVTDLSDGQTETTLYEYVEATENTPAHVILTTIKGKDHISLTKVIDVDENGDYDDNQFIYRQIRTVEDGEPTIITIGKNQNGQILEQKNKADKTIVNIYNESRITEFDKNNSERLYQEIKYSEDESYNVFYDGQGNTYLPIKNGEGINNFLARVNKELRKLGQKELTIEDLKRLNPKVDLNNLKVANPHTGDTGMLLISGIHEADSSIVKGSGTVAGNAQAQANDAMRKAAERVNNKNFKNHTLTKTYTSFDALAKELGVDVLELMTLNQSETSSNGLVALTKGATIRVPVELTSSDTPEMIKRAFPLNAQNRIFYQRYNSLNETQKRNVLNVVRSMQGKSAKEIKDAILNVYPDINLFDSGLTVPIKRSMQGYQAGQSNIVSLETFITDYLKLDLKSEKGQIIYKRLTEAFQSSPLATMQSPSFGINTKPATTDEERYIQAVQANLNQLAASEFPNCSKMEVHQILELLFNAGIPRTRQESEIHQRQLEQNPMYQQKKRQEFAADVLYNMMKQASDILHDYYSKIGYLSGDAVWQGLKNIANYATFGNVETIWKEMDKLDDMVARVEKLKHAPNHVEFEKLFKEFTNGFAFDNDKMQNLIDITIKVQKGEITADSTEYINAFKGAFGSNVNLDIVSDTQKSVSGQQTKGSICDIVMMLTALGNIGKLAKAKQFAQWAISALGKYGGSALVGATNLAGWTAVQKGTNLLTREADVTSEDLKEYGWEIVQSGGFGAAGGVWGNLAVSRVMGWTDKVVDKGLQKYLPKAVEKHMAKVATKVGDLFKTTSSTTAGTVSKNGVDVMAIAAKTPGWTAQGTGFLTEVAGFTGYQTIVDTAVSMIQQGGIGIESIQNILIQKAQMKGELTDEKLAEIKNMSYTEAMLNLLAEEGGEQLQSLGTIKGVEQAMKFIISGRIGMVPDAASFENCKTLKGMEIKPTSVDGKQFYEITMPDGKKMVANNEHELIAFCNQQMQIDMLTNIVTEKLKKEGVEVSGVALVKTMGADRATVRTAKEGYRTSNLQVKPINVDGQIKYEITDADGNIRTVDKVIDVINTTQTALSIDKIESVVNKQLKSSQSISAKSLLKLVMSRDAEPIQINGTEIKPNEVLENSSVLENWKISKTDVDGNEVYTLTMDNGRTVNVNSIENVINLCENRFRFAILEKIALENPESIEIPNTNNTVSSIEQRLASANDRESFVAIRDEIKKMPNGEEKTRLMQLYLQKYNAWSADPSRPDIRMQYIPENENHTSNINQQLLNETVDALKQLGASDKQIEEFKANCDDEVLSFVQERLNSPDFSPFADGYLKSLNKHNLALMKKLSSDPNFDVLCLGLVANAAYTPYLVKQIEGAYDNGKDILPGCQRILQHRAKVEAEAQDPAVIARKQAYENAQTRIMENTALTKRDIDDLPGWVDIREESIQDLIIYCEKNGIKSYQNLLYRCYENRQGDRYPSEVIKKKVELALRGLENKLEPSEISGILFEYDKNDIDTVNKMFDTAIEERRIELQKQAEKELAINNRKNELREKYNNSTISNAIEGILNSEKLPEELLFKIDELLGDTPTEATCKFLFDCIEKIDSKKFNLSEFINNFNSELKLPNLVECKITESWKTEAENCTQRQISSDYLTTLTNPKGEPLFNVKMVAAIEELAKTNPKAANLIVDKCIKNPDFAKPFIVIHLCNAAKTDANLAFSILDMKNNNGSARFDALKLGSILSAITENSDLIRETTRLEQLGNVRLSYTTHKINVDYRSGNYESVKYEIDDLRTEFAVEVGKYLETKRTVDGREMYHSYWDIQECLYDAIKTNPDVALYYLNKNSSSDYRAVFDGRVVKALASMTPRLENYFRKRFESITNDDGYVQTDHIKDEIGAINESNAQLAEKLYLDIKWKPNDIKSVIEYVNNENSQLAEKLIIELKWKPDDVVDIIKNINNSYPIDFFTEETCNILHRIKNDGADISKTLFALFDESIPQKLPDKIKTLLTLQMLTPEDIQIFKKHGIDINKKIEIFQNAIDKKHPIIETKPENARAILKALANNGNADEVLQNMDFSMFEQNGIRLQYTREEFMQKMTELIAKYQSSFDASLENVEIPALKLSTEQEARTQDKINQLRSEKKIKTYTFVKNGKECTVERFLESKPNGSNEGDFALIDGKLYYIKFPSSDKLGQSVEEVIASQLYRAAGVDAPNETYLIDKNGVVRGMASEYVPEMQNLRDKSMLFDSFAVDAWLANWDAPKNDNTQMYGDGNVIKSDVGGALHYRAQGELKLDFGNVVNELVSLIENNPLYANMSKADLLKSLEHVINVPDEAIIKVVKDSPNSDNNLIFTLLKRKEFIQIFTEKVKMLDETKFNNITSLIKEAKRLATKDFEDTPDVAGMLGYTPTKDGFEGLLNTQDLSGKDLTPEQRTIADEMRAEIRRFTVDNRLADDVDVSVETRDFINGILQGVPEFAAYFGKPQHGNGNVDADGRQISGHQYPLDIHILKVLQSSVNDPWYSKTDSTGDRILDDESRIVLKFSALLHDIGKKYLTGRDAGHASLSAEYVYSILDRFNLPTRTKNRIINMVNNHHWLETYCKGQISDETVATMFRTTEDFTIARIMARADLENVREGFFTKTMMADFPKEVHNSAEANQKFEQIMDQIQSKVDIIEKNQPMIMPSKFVEVPERVTSDGRVIARRGFPIVQKMLDGKMETFKVLNLHDLDPETDMYQYGFGHIKLKDLRLLVHRAGDGNRTNFNTFKLLGANPQNTSLQSLTLIKATDPGTYRGANWSFIIEGNMNNIGVAYKHNAATGRLKTLEFLVDEFFGNGKKDFKPDDQRRTFFRDYFVDYFKNKGIEVDDKTYATILKYVRNKQYVETQIKDLKIGDKIFKKEDLIEGLLFAKDSVIEEKPIGEHDELTQMDCVPVAGGISAESFDHVADDFLRICRDNCDGKMIIW